MVEKEEKEKEDRCDEEQKGETEKYRYVGERPLVFHRRRQRQRQRRRWRRRRRRHRRSHRRRTSSDDGATVDLVRASLAKVG